MYNIFRRKIKKVRNPRMPILYVREENLNVLRGLHAVKQRGVNLNVVLLRRLSIVVVLVK